METNRSPLSVNEAQRRDVEDSKGDAGEYTLD